MYLASQPFTSDCAGGGVTAQLCGVLYAQMPCRALACLAPYLMLCPESTSLRNHSHLSVPHLPDTQGSWGTLWPKRLSIPSGPGGGTASGTLLLPWGRLGPQISHRKDS